MAVLRSVGSSETVSCFSSGGGGGWRLRLAMGGGWRLRLAMGGGGEREEAAKGENVGSERNGEG